MSSSLPSIPKEMKHEVFLSFRGEDTRDNFTDDLYAALTRKGIQTFRDEEGLERGEAIAPKLLEAIEESRYAVVILSENYASSKWCLEELEHIVQFKENKGVQNFFPVFYHVDPSDVRNHRGKFGKYLSMHEENVKIEKGKVERWKKCLKELADVSGWDLKNRDESEVIKKIVDHISNLKMKYARGPEVLIGMDSRVKEVELLLDLDMKSSDDHHGRTIGIWGMGGIGKTTLARQVFDKIGNQFGCSIFVDRVREEYGKHGRGLVYLQNELNTILLDSHRDDDIKDIEMGKKELKDRLHSKKVLIVLDDVDNLEQVKALADESWLGPGSRVIITTRDKETLKKCEVGYHKTYEVKKLSHREAFLLFCLKAFKKYDAPDDSYRKMSNKFVEYAGGLPLALKVLGSYLNFNGGRDWAEELDKLKVHSKDGINGVLEISCRGLEENLKEMFLDIACFFNGEDQDRVTKIFESCGFFPKNGIPDLVDKSLITIDQSKKLWMHDLLQQMGRKIVEKENPKRPGERSRLWVYEDTYKSTSRKPWYEEVLKKKTGTPNVEGMFLSLPEKKHIELDSDAFTEMCNLRLLKICNANFSVCPEDLSEELRFLEWHQYPFESLPSSFRPSKLVELNMPSSNIEQLWKGGLSLMENLVQINLSNCKCLTETPDLSNVSNLELLILEGCEKLSEVHRTIGNLQHLVLLNLKGCASLQSLPHSISLKSLNALILSGCSKLEAFPDIGGSMKDLEILRLDGTAIKELPASIRQMEGLVLLNLRGCKELLSLPSDAICSLTRLKKFDLSGCSNIDQLPEHIGSLEQLEELDACQTAIRKVPSSILLLKNLKLLCFGGCKDERTGLQLPNSFSGLSSLTNLTLGDCRLETIPDDIGSLSSLQRLDLSANDFVSVPESISQLSELRHLRLSGCSKLQSLPKILPAKLTDVDACDCPMLKNNSNSLTVWASDKGFCFIKCGKSEDKEDNWAHAPLPLPEDQIEALFPKYIEERIYNDEPFEMRFPHSARIPDWWSQCSDIGKDSVTIPLYDPEDGISRWLGFALFVVFEITKLENFDESWELEETLCHFDTNEGRLEKPLVFQNFNGFRVGLSYGLCCYQPRRGQFAGQLSDASRLLRATVSTKRPDLIVKGCGIGLITRRDDAEFIQSLTQTTNQHLDLRFGRHCKRILDKAMKLASSDDLTELGPDLQDLPSTSTVKQRSYKNFSKIHSREELGLRSHFLLKRLYEGRNGREKNFHFSFRRPIISRWFHHYAGDVALCHLPPNLYDDERWIGLELYAVFTWSPSNLSEHNPLASLLLHVDLCSPARSIMHSSIKILDFFGCHQRVVLHFPRACFPQHELNQCKGISALFRTSTPDVEVQVCGSRLVYEQDLEELIEALIVESAYMDPHVALLDLSLQAGIHVESIEKCFLREAETDEHSAVALDGETREFIEICKGQLLNIGSATPVPEQVSTSRLQKYKSYLEQKQGFILGPGYMIVHSKHSLLETRDSVKEHVVEIESNSLVSHLHVMTETQIYGSCNLAKWKKDLEKLLQIAEEATLSLKGHTISVLRHFDPSFEYNFCFPQKEILEWFKGQSTESSRVGIHLPPGLYDDNNWRGLVICAAYTVHEHPAATLENLGSELSVKLLCHLRTEEYCLNPMPLYSTTKEKFKWLHLRGFIWLTYIPRVYLAEFNGVKVVEARIYNNSPGLSVANCAVRLLYQNEVQELRQSITQCWTSFFDNSDLIRQFVEPDENVQPSHADHIREKPALGL